MNKTPLAKIDRRSVAQDAYEAIRESIITGQFRGGEQLVEARLAADLGTSRGPVREALKRLREDGLVFDDLHRGSFVREFPAGEIVDLYNARIGLESVAIRIATRDRLPTARLRRHIAEMEAAAQADELPLLSEHEFAFHEALCELSGNDYIADLFRSISAKLRVALHLDSAEHEDRFDLAAHHQALVAVIEAGDEDEAARQLERHIVYGVPEVLARLAGAEGAEAALSRLLGMPADDTHESRAATARGGNDGGTRHA
jgi:DNA-binding GntR family transcriptional regulator